MARIILPVERSGVIFPLVRSQPSPEQTMSDADATHDGLQLNPYHAVVRRKVIHSFRRLNERDPSAALALMADDVRYTFSGDHALGGTRVSRAGVEKWFGRLLRLFRSTFRLQS